MLSRSTLSAVAIGAVIGLSPTLASSQPARPGPGDAPPAATSGPVAAPAIGARPSPPAKADKSPGEKNAVMGNLGGNGKEPIKIDADRLDVFDRDGRAVFKGNVVAVQGESTIRCTEMIVSYEQRRGGENRSPANAAAGGDAIKQIDCKGPVTVVSKDQVATGDNAVFDRKANKVVLTGNVALSQCQNVTRGERVVYDMNTGVANVETAPGGRVRALFIPGSNDSAQPKQGCQAQSGTPSPAAAPPAQAAKPAPKARAATN